MHKIVEHDNLVKLHRTDYLFPKSLTHVKFKILLSDPILPDILKQAISLQVQNSVVPREICILLRIVNSQRL